MPASAFLAPAKLNLFLHVTGRRPDGYHLLQTIFQFVDHGDVVELTVRDDGVIRRSADVPGVPVGDDLTVRAATLLREASGSPRGVEIRLDKRLPIGAGLGGGSSDAATTLIGLNRLWGLGLDLDALAALGLRLGADVPVFVRGRAAWAEGVGDALRPVTLAEPVYLVVTPPVFVSTREVYQAPELVRDCAPVSLAEHVAGRTGNVCEPVTIGRYPVVAEALAWARARGAARMTGTGASVFLAFDDEAAAERARAEVPASWWSFVARGRNVSPLHAALGLL
jgi:4-diphosphocytidyl-2-C-methyl-D-erythritol kinase